MSVKKHQNSIAERSDKNYLQDSEVSKFYSEKSVFITGAAGFLGVVLLETLLRCCPGIQKIYILLRAKNGTKPGDRKEQIFKKEIFNKVKEENIDALMKVIVIAGDITEENLGMSEKDLKRLAKEVSIVFHCAAAISFSKPLSYIMTHNVIGMDNIIDLCHKLEKLEVLVYTSTIYSHCNQPTEIDEKVHKFNFKAEHAVSLSRKGDIEGLDHLFSSVDPPYPNFYTFSKGVAENLLADKGKNLPACIVRPSVIVCCTKGSMPGYIEEGTVLTSLSLGVGKGFIRVGPIFDDEMHIEFIPADVAANTHIVAAYLQATKSLPSPAVYNCTADIRISWEIWFYSLMNMVINNPIPNSYLIPGVVLCKNPYIYKLYTIIYHYIPGYTIDVFLWMVGSEFRMIKTYKFYERSLEKTRPFLTGGWIFKCENFKSLPEKLNSIDSEIFCVDMKDFSLEKFIEILRSGCPFFRAGNKPYKETFLNTFIRYFLTYLLRISIIGSIILFFYMVLFKRIINM